MKAEIWHYALTFRRPARTSRALMTVKDTYFIRIYSEECPTEYGVGECALFKGLSSDDRPSYEAKLKEVCDNLEVGENIDLTDWPSIRFGVETALADYANGCRRRPFPSSWSNGQGGILTNGLVWMDTPQVMLESAIVKASAGFRCIKMKIGAHDFKSEYEMIDRFRRQFGPEKVELRLDANGAFPDVDTAIDRLNKLSVFDVHSLEQPIKAGQWTEMANICRNSPIAIALDEELIGINRSEEKKNMLDIIDPQYIILKPSLCGGFGGSEEWIKLAHNRKIGWWATSALESNVGLNAIAQWISGYGITMPQGLGTGMLYENNIPSPLWLNGEMLCFNPEMKFDI